MGDVWRRALRGAAKLAMDQVRQHADAPDSERRHDVGHRRNASGLGVGAQERPRHHQRDGEVGKDLAAPGLLFKQGSQTHQAMLADDGERPAGEREPDDDKGSESHEVSPSS